MQISFVWILCTRKEDVRMNFIIFSIIRRVERILYRPIRLRFVWFFFDVMVSNASSFSCWFSTNIVCYMIEVTFYSLHWFYSRVDDGEPVDFLCHSSLNVAIDLISDFWLVSTFNLNKLNSQIKIKINNRGKWWSPRIFMIRCKICHVLYV